MSDVKAVKRYGYEYSQANDAFEIAPIGVEGELNCENELCITATNKDIRRALLS
jgi:aspartate carbamoyltransferase regulatory subunit